MLEIMKFLVEFNKENKMTPEQLKEVNAKVEFQMNELLTGIRNRAHNNWQSSFHGNSQRYAHYWEAFKELEDMFKKEQMMIEPIQILSDEEWVTKRDSAVEKLSHRLLKRGSREYFHDRKFIVHFVEELLR